MTSIRISCRDVYEAQKLASLALPREDGAFITGIINVIEDELVVSLKDKSAHSVVLSNSVMVEELADFLQSVTDSEHKIVDAKSSGIMVEITKI